jgi:hypothetical protein
VNHYSDGKVWHECYCKKKYSCQACTSGNSWACSTVNSDEDGHMCDECLERFGEEYEADYMRDIESRGYRSWKLLLLDWFDSFLELFDRSWFPWAVLAIFALTMTMITYDPKGWNVSNLIYAGFALLFTFASVKRM